MSDYAYFLYGLYAVIVFAGIVLNMLLLIILFKIKKQRKSYFALVISLIFADLGLPLCTVLTVSVAAAGALYTWEYYSSYFYRVSYEYLLYVILLNLIALAAEHYVAIIKPLHYVNWVRCRYIVCRLCAVWIIPVLLVCLGYSMPETKVTVMEKWTDGKRNMTGFYELDIDMKDAFRIPFILVCSIVMTIVYIHIYFVVRKQQRLDQLQNQHAKNNNKALVTTTFNLLSFFVCWFPPVVAEISFQLYKPSAYYDFIIFDFWMRQAIPSIVYCNSICDPLIFALRLSAIQKMWKRKFCCHCCLYHRKSPLKKMQDKVRIQNMCDDSLN